VVAFLRAVPSSDGFGAPSAARRRPHRQGGHGGGGRTVGQAAGHAGHHAVAVLLFAHRFARHFRGGAVFFQRFVDAVVVRRRPSR
jgi:hypothetical protein